MRVAATVGRGGGQADPISSVRRAGIAKEVCALIDIGTVPIPKVPQEKLRQRGDML